MDHKTVNRISGCNWALNLSVVEAAMAVQPDHWRLAARDATGDVQVGAKFDCVHFYLV